MQSKNKRGSILDIFVVIVLIFVFALCIPISKKIYNGVNESLSPQLNAGGQAAMNNVGNIFPIWNTIFLFVLICLGIAAVVMASQMDFAPIFFPFAIIIGGFAVVVVSFFGTAWQTYAASPQIATEMGSFTAINWVMTHLTAIIVGIIFIIIIIMFTKNAFGGGGGQ